MRRHDCKNIIFSSSATVYGDPAIIPITEECPKGHCTNPYGQTKSMLEEVLMDVQKADQVMGEQQVLAQASLKGDAAHLLEERHIDGDGS